MSDRTKMVLLIVAVAAYVPIMVAGTFPPPRDMSPFSALANLAWLSIVGGFAGYGLWKMP